MALMASDAFDERKMLKHTDPGRAFAAPPPFGPRN